MENNKEIIIDIKTNIDELTQKTKQLKVLLEEVKSLLQSIAPERQKVVSITVSKEDLEELDKTTLTFFEGVNVSDEIKERIIEDLKKEDVNKTTPDIIVSVTVSKEDLEELAKERAADPIAFKKKLNNF